MEPTSSPPTSSPLVDTIPDCDMRKTSWPPGAQAACSSQIMGSIDYGSQLSSAQIVRTCSSSECRSIIDAMVTDNPHECMTSATATLHADFLRAWSSTCHFFYVDHSSLLSPPLMVVTERVTVARTTAPPSTTEPGIRDSTANATDTLPPILVDDKDADQSGKSTGDTTASSFDSGAGSAALLASEPEPQVTRRTGANKPRPPTPGHPNMAGLPGVSQEVREGEQDSRVPLPVPIVAIVLASVLLAALVGLLVRRRRQRCSKAKHFHALSSPAAVHTPGPQDDLTITSSVESTTGKGILSADSSAYSSSDNRRSGEDLASLLQPLVTWRINTSDLTDVALIGCGSQGAIYLVKLGANRLLVSKRIIHDQLTERRLKSLIAEVELVATLHHPSIVTFVGVTWSTPFDLQALFEYMPNGDLRTYLDKNAPSRSEPWTTTKLKMALAVAQGLAYVHSFNPPIVHRDLKARNILLDKKLAAKISDFGVSRLQSDDGTMTTGVGTSRWLAPEVIVGGGRYTEQCDIYSFGVLLVEMDTHTIPYATEAASLSEVMLLRRVCRGELRLQVSSSCDSRIAALVNRCLHQDPSQRHNALALCFELRNILKETKA